MTNYRRLRVPGGTYAFTLHLQTPGARLLTSHITELRAAYAATHYERPFVTEAIVVLPDHLHAIWRLPPGDDDFSTRWRLIKKRFSQALPGGPRRPSQMRKGEKGIWQRRFWEHLLRDEAEMEACKRYIWSDPMRHNLVSEATDWPHSSIHRDGGEMGKIYPSHVAKQAFGDDNRYGSIRVPIGKADLGKIRRPQFFTRLRAPQIGGQARA